MLKSLFIWCKKEIVLTIAIGLAIVSSFFVTPDKEYIGYIDFRTLSILFCLMAVMVGLQKSGVFKFIAESLLKRVKHIRVMAFILIMLSFFSSMLITNDVALITFVPFTFIVLNMVFPSGAEKLLVSIVVMQTIAANLGSMLTPIGNPQNLYLYGKAEMGLIEFLGLMLPYTLAAFLVLSLWCVLFRHKGDTAVSFELKEKTSLAAYKKQIVIYVALFAVSLLTVAHIIPYYVTLVITIIVVLFVDKSVLKKVDYALLLTFIGFFIFIGNMGRVPMFNDMINRLVVGNEVITSIVSSQVISNVPAALLLSGFTNEYKLLLIGTNLGGLGTVIASMASLISFKYIGKEYKELRGRYLIYFTLANIIFLAVLFVLYYILVSYSISK